MIWVGWRQQRTETVIAAAILALLAVLLIPTGIAMISAYNHDGLAACLRSPAPGRLRAGARQLHRRASSSSAT